MNNQEIHSSGKGVADDEIDLLEYGRILWRWKRLTIALLALVCVVILTYNFIRKPVYEAIVTMIPNEKPQTPSLGALGGLAANFGFSMPSTSDPSDIYREILLSRSFLKSYVNKTLPTEKHREGISIPAYFKIQTQDEDSLFISVAAKMKKLIDYEKDGSISVLSVVSNDPIFSASLANDLLVALKQFVQENRLSKLKKNRIFIETRLAEMERELKVARKNLSLFRQKNQRIDANHAPQLLDQQAWLMQEVRIKEEIYLLLKKEFEMARIEEEKEKPFIQVLDNAIPPSPTFKPGKKLLFGVVFLASGFFGILLSFLGEFMYHHKLFSNYQNSLVARLRQ